VCDACEKVSSRFEQVRLLEDAVEAQVPKEIGGNRGAEALREPPVDRIPSPVPSLPGGGGGGSGVPKVSISLDSLHVAVVVECSQPAASG